MTDRATDSIHAFALGIGGLAQGRVMHRSSGATPYGFEVTEAGVLVVTEAAGAQAGKASASSYKLDGPAQLAPASGAVGNTRSEVCWAVTTNDGRSRSSRTSATERSRRMRSATTAASSSATPVDGEPGIRDEALSSDRQYLYALHSDTGRVLGWKVGEDGSLAAIGSANGLPLTAAGLAAS